jgi:uncharacterized Tic20 family protein
MNVTTATTTVMPTTTNAALTQPAPGSLTADYVESMPAQRSEAQIAHLCGIFGVLGTGVYYLVKKNDAGPFVRDQMKEAFNFHVLVFCAAIALSIVGAIATVIVGMLGLVFSLASFALIIGALVLSITNAMKAGKGHVARYPARLSVLK